MKIKQKLSRTILLLVTRDNVSCLNGKWDSYEAFLNDFSLHFYYWRWVCIMYLRILSLFFFRRFFALGRQRTQRILFNLVLLLIEDKMRFNCHQFWPRKMNLPKLSCHPDGFLIFSYSFLFQPNKENALGSCFIIVLVLERIHTCQWKVEQPSV